MSNPGNDRPLPAAHYLRLVDAALAVSHYDHAIEAAQEALGNGVEHPVLLALRAQWLEEQGRPQEALADLQRARELAPRDIGVLQSLGECLARLERPADAIMTFNSAIAIYADHAPLHFNKGFAHELMGDMEAARAAHEQAVKLDPNHAQALGRLATLAAGRRDWKSAREHAQNALEADPMMATASFAQAQADLAEKQFSHAEQRMRPIDSQQYSPHARSLANSYLGDALDGQDRLDEAFEAYVEAGKLLREVYAPRLVQPGMESATAMVERLQTYFEAAPAWSPGEEPRDGQPAAGHVFVVGFPYSGAMLFGSLLNKSSNAFVRERDAFSPLAREYFANTLELDRLAAVGPEEIGAIRRIYWNGCGAPAEQLKDKIYVDTLPFNLFHLPIIAKLFPRAKILLAVRDPRDVVLSCLRNRFGMHLNSYDLTTLDGAARYFGATMRLAETYQNKLPLTFKTVRCEDLIHQPGMESRAVCEFAGTAWEPAMETITEDHSEAVTAWRRYARQLAPVLPALSPWAAAFGYSED
ncbi:MAG: sulfotransferase [Proteobacteria bacterium]|nr:sulfotransferase [Pseudomonadota bacterium]